MFSLPNNQTYPQVNVAALRAHLTAMQKSNTTAQMLFEQFNYMPGIVRNMNDLSIAVQRATFDMRNQARTDIIHLERARDKLKGYQAELAYPEDVEEVREDMENELKSTSNKISERYEDLKVIRSSLSTAYDRATSQQWIATLQQDRDVTEALKVKSDEKLTDLEKQMKSASEGIDLIAKAGVEKIGQEAQLTLDNLKALGLAPPQVQIALLAIDTLKKIISGIGEAISFLNMLDAYNKLRDKAADLRVQLKKYKSDIARTDGKIQLVNALDQMDEGRWGYVNEFSNLVNGFDSFRRDFRQDKSQPVEERADAAIARITEVVRYLKSVQQ